MKKNNKLLLPLAVVFTTVMTMVSRMAGGMKPKLPLGLDQWIYSIPYGVITWFALTFVDWDAYLEYGLIALAFFGAFLGKRTGHGNFMVYPFNPKKIIEHEKLGYILNLFMGKDPRVTAGNNATALANIKRYGETKLAIRCQLGLALTGLAVPLIAGIILLLLGFWIGALALWVGGLMKAPSYLVPWLIWKWPNGRASWWVNHNAEGYKYNFFRDEFSEATQFGEAFTGLFGAVGLVVAYMDIIGVI